MTQKATPETPKPASLSTRDILFSLDNINTRYASLITQCFLLQPDFVDMFRKVMRHNYDVMERLLEADPSCHYQLMRFTPESLNECPEKQESEVSQQAYLKAVVDLHAKLIDIIHAYETLLREPDLLDSNLLKEPLHEQRMLAKTCKFTVNSYL